MSKECSFGMSLKNYREVKMGKVLIFLADGHEEIEALTVVDLLRRAGIEIETVSITGKREVTSSHKVTIIADKLLDEVDFDKADMLVLPGGMPGTLNLEACEPLMKQVRAFNEKGKYIAAICAAPTVFGRAGLLKGKKACCYPDMEGDLKGAKVSYDHVCVDGNVITSRGMGTAIEFGLAIIEKFQGKDAADSMATKVVFGL